jgi:hypothetical protein
MDASADAVQLPWRYVMSDPNGSDVREQNDPHRESTTASALAVSHTEESKGGVYKKELPTARKMVAFATLHGAWSAKRLASPSLSYRRNLRAKSA